MTPFRTLENYCTRFPDLASQTHSRLIEILGYYIQNSSARFFDSNSMARAYEALDLSQPANFADYFTKMRARGLLVKHGTGYRLSRTASDRISAELGSPSLAAISSELERLPSMLTGNEAAFLQESINCLRVKAWRAAIVMSWVLTVNHLQEYVLTNGLSAFNAALSRNSRYTSVAIRSKEDFEEIKEADFIQLLRSAGLITNDQRKLLDEKLGIRNSFAHPSGMAISEAKVTAFLEDLVYNILTKLS